MIRLIGATSSPYTQKMVALLRYRRLPYAVKWGMPAQICESMGVEIPRPVLMPTFLFEVDGRTEAVCDSTPVIRRLERAYVERSVVPTDPALALLDYLIEDFADEWCAKYLFHYRWSVAHDADNAGTLIPLGFDISMSSEAHRAFKHQITAHQINRLYVVGSSATTAPVIEGSYRRFLALMERHLATQPFMLGNRPGAGDFGLFGQLNTLVGVDPTPRAIAHEVSPRTVAWVELMRDQSGLEPTEEDWVRLEDQPNSLRALMEEIGRVYVPAQLANDRASRAKETTWEADIDRISWHQQTFPYQAKCLQWTREMYQALSSANRGRIDDFLKGTGVESMLSVGRSLTD